MKCKACKHTIDDDSIYCKFCGEKQIRERKKKAELKVPAPRQLPSGTWFNRITVDGQRVCISAATEAEYYAKARAAKAGLIQVAKTAPRLTLEQACKAYNAQRSAVLSPSTLRGYDIILRNRFTEYMHSDITTINYQKMVNDEAAKCSSKTLINAWGYVRSALKCVGFDAGSVALPQLVSRELPWLEPEQLSAFLDVIKGSRYELGALLALHGLRRSEVLALRPEDITDGVIHVNGAAVIGPDGKLIYKRTTKNTSSRRAVKIRVHRLQSLVDEWTGAADVPYTAGINPNSIYSGINRACEAAGLPRIGVHGLRRSFASLAYSLGWSSLATMREGGWADKTTMDKKYTKLAEADALKQSDSMSEFFASIENGNENGNGL